MVVMGSHAQTLDEKTSLVKLLSILDTPSQ